MNVNFWDQYREVDFVEVDLLGILLKLINMGLIYVISIDFDLLCDI